MSTTTFEGVLPALITPFTTDAAAIDFEALDASSNGVSAPG